MPKFKSNIFLFKANSLILVLIMAISFFGLLFLQVEYLQSTLRTRNEEFNLSVQKSLFFVSKNLDEEQTKYYFETAILKDYKHNNLSNSSDSLKSFNNFWMKKHVNPSLSSSKNKIFVNSSNSSLSQVFSYLQKSLRKRYLYERKLIDDVIIQLLYEASEKPILERVDPRDLDANIRYELANNGLNAEYEFQILNPKGQPVYTTPNFIKEKGMAEYSQILFPNDPPSRLNVLKVYFPDKKQYVFQSALHFFVPSIIFTFTLMIAFSISMFLLYRQRKFSEMKNDFINNMTHELKTPVSTISLAMQWLLDKKNNATPEIRTTYMNVVAEEAKRLQFQVDKVLHMALLDDDRTILKLEEIDMTEIIIKVANTFDVKIKSSKKNDHLDIDLLADETIVDADKMHITNVLFNLLDNAFKYRRENVPLELMIRTWNDGNKLCVSVEDNGKGIKKEDLKKIFDRFFRVSTGNVHDVKGYGLGLAYVKKVIDSHHGKVRVESEYGKGTKFIITLPTKNYKL